jgi:transketolase
VYSIANFPTFRCLEQIRNDICYAGASVTIVSVGSGFSYGSHGSTHHAIEDLSIMRSLPGITVVSPGDPVETRAATHALANMARPAYLRLGKAGEPVVTPHASDEFAIGKMRRIRDGSDVTLVATGSVLTMVDAAAEALDREGISARVYSAHTLKPFDTETLLAAMAETAGLLTVEEHRLVGGLRSAVAEALLDSAHRPMGAIRSLGIGPDVMLGTGDQAYLRTACGLGVDQIADAARALLATRTPAR